MRENEAVSCLSGGLQEGAEIEKSAFYTYEAYLGSAAGRIQGHDSM